MIEQDAASALFRTEQPLPDAMGRGAEAADPLANSTSSLNLWPVELAAIVVAAPLLLLPRPASAAILVLLPVLWLVRLIARRQALSRRAVDLPVAGLLLMLYLSVLFSADRSLSWPKLAGLIFGLYVFSVVLEYVDTAARRRLLTAGLVLGGVAVSAAGLLGASWHTFKIPQLDALYARLPHLITAVPTSVGAVETGIHPNEVAGTLVLLLPLAVAICLLGSRPWATLAGLAAVPMAAVLLLTASRSGLAGAAAALALLAIIRWPRLTWAPLVSVGLLCAAAVVVAAIGPDRLPGAHRASELTQASEADALGRVDVWRAAVRIIHDFPLTGPGLNTFPLMLHTAYPLQPPDPEAPTGSLNAGDTDQLRLAQSGTVEAWVNPRRFPKPGHPAVIATKGSLTTEHNFYGVYIAGSAMYFEVDGPSNTTYIGVALDRYIPLGRWSQVALTWSGSKLAAYVNGSFVADRALRGVPDTAGFDLQIGNTVDYPVDGYFDGRLEGVSVSKTPLPAAAIQDAYQAGPQQTPLSQATGPQQAYQTTIEPAEWIDRPVTPLSGELPHAHDVVLQVAVDLGLPGLLCFLAVVALAGLSLARAWRSPQRERRVLAIGLAAGLLASAIFGIADTVALGAKPGVFLWMALGLCFVLSPLGQRRAAGPVQYLQWGLFSGACALGISLALATGPL